MDKELKQQDIVTKRFDTNPDVYADEYRRETPAGYSFRMRKSRLLEILGVSSNGKVLDIGCGPAVMSQEILQKGWAYTGMDISPNMIEEAKKRVPGADFKVGSVEKMAFEDGSFDSVVAMGLVEYLDNQSPALREIYRVLKSGGNVFISVPNWWSPARMWDRYLITPLSSLLRPITKKQYDGVFHREYSLSQYRNILEREGFIFSASIYYNFRIVPRPFDYWLPFLSVFTAKMFELLRFTPLRFLGTGFIVMAKKK